MLKPTPSCGVERTLGAGTGAYSSDKAVGVWRVMYMCDWDDSGIRRLPQVVAVQCTSNRTDELAPIDAMSVYKCICRSKTSVDRQVPSFAGYLSSTCV